MSKEIKARKKAFEQERILFRKEKQELRQQIKLEQRKQLNLKQELQESQAKNQELQDWIERLLAYTDLDEDTFCKLKENAEIDHNIALRVDHMFSAFCKYL